jgi:hypothetical protein
MEVEVKVGYWALDDFGVFGVIMEWMAHVLAVRI